MTISLKNTVLWNPSSDISMYAFHENVLQLIIRLTYAYDIYIIIHINSVKERDRIQFLLENTQGGLFTGGYMDQRKIIYCSEEEGKVHIIRHIEPVIHIEGGWEEDDGEKIVKRLQPFIKKIVWIVTKRKMDLMKSDHDLKHNVELAERLADTSIAREVMENKNDE
ncbi:hypothetical protein G6F46_006601 [Rhizopus delemar]|uniref:Uncharacterized protein n=2 Tax=Rhizopus TaxID=4842 RepID=A0A9P6Z2S1_9FUNG|nr:hypothetical protein G6F43_006576 [Rhizopus delemar]KAG1546491.1 hypothetical protein G6F51_004844 [Rhizopus arrhizus]KAG1458394.1 hypothetical protein G6F55_005373 [Rhizopus delemar]KAG1497068.1 hypothetical protein G6F54_006027 [Rhizopus delemar]KAG1510960.1 hypothetical protein G6F53_006292 [Rhizopus delemar]